MARNDGMVVLENAALIFRNFEGKEGPMNPRGSRNFCVLLSVEQAEQLLADGWNVKTLKAREDDPTEEVQPYIQIQVSYKNRPPRVVMITSGGRTNLDEDTVETLDWVDIKTADICFIPYEWSLPGGKSGIKAYLKSAFITIEEDPLEMKYSKLNDLPSLSGREG